MHYKPMNFMYEVCEINTTTVFIRKHVSTSKEQETLAFIRENLEKSDQLTKGMVSSLLCILHNTHCLILGYFSGVSSAMSVVPLSKLCNVRMHWAKLVNVVFVLKQCQPCITEGACNGLSIEAGLHTKTFAADAVCCQVSILSSFESRLMQLENSIIPVHKQTENLQRLQENVDKTLSCMDHVISYYHVAKDTDKIIREG